MSPFFHPHITKGFGSGLCRRPRCNNATIISRSASHATRDGLEYRGPDRRAVDAEGSLSNDDGEDEVDARRLIRVRGIDDHWGRIDRF